GGEGGAGRGEGGGRRGQLGRQRRRGRAPLEHLPAAATGAHVEGHVLDLEQRQHLERRGVEALRGEREPRRVEAQRRLDRTEERRQRAAQGERRIEGRAAAGEAGPRAHAAGDGPP